MSSSHRRRIVIPEVVQSSATDCGPASIKSVFSGMGRDLDYAALREACQTDVDGSSIDTMEELSKQLGLDAEQIMLPLDHVFLSEAKALPAVIVTLTPGGRPHFVVLWSRIGPFVQVMDPATGRHWTTIGALAARLYQHTTVAPGAAWREWAGSDEATAALKRRLGDLRAADADQLVAAALEDSGHVAIATLDAATRAVEAVVQAGAIRRGREAGGLVRSMIARSQEGAVEIPECYWSVRPNEGGADDEVLLRGAVLLRFRGWRADVASGATAAPSRPLAPDLAKALSARSANARQTLFGLLREDPLSIPLLIAGGLVLTAAGRIVQALMLRAILDLGRDLGTVKQRAAGLAVLVVIALLLLLMQAPISLGLLGIGRRLEVRLRKAYFEKLPKTEDRYFQSRLTSDMASRCHAIQSMRTLPGLVAQAITITLEVLTTAAALVWVAPAEWHVTLALTAVTLLVPLVAQALFFEPDMRVQTHGGALNGFVLNALVGLTPIRLHGAERSLRRGHEALLVEWAKVRASLQSLSVGFEAVLTAASYGIVVYLLYAYLRASQSASLVLLMVFWAMRFPVLGQRLLVLTRSFPSAMNRVRRLLEMIGTIESTQALPSAAATRQELVAPAVARSARGVGITLDGVRVKGGGRVILDKVSLSIAPGEHVAIVGVSGAGKSTLVGLLLGWLRPARGTLLVDGSPLDQPAVERLRRETAWVDPAINLWNESLLENLRYGSDAGHAWSLDEALKSADVLDILETLPEGLQTTLGEGGGLVSGGQGQRVRLARAMLRKDARLAILDEPFRGLDRERRARLLAECRRRWKDVTLMCVTHDVVQTQDFDRVLVVEGGRVVENAPPAELLAREGSRYAELVRADVENHQMLWRAGTWRRWWLEGRALRERSEA